DLRNEVLLAGQEFFYHLLHLVVTSAAAAAKTHDPLAIYYELRRPEVAKIIAPNLLFIVDHDGILDAHLGHGLAQPRHILLIVSARRVDTNDDQSFTTVLVV